LQYYDAILGGGNPELERALGYKKIFVAGRDFNPVNIDSSNDDPRGKVVIGSRSTNLLKAVKRLAKAVIPLDMQVDKRVIEAMKDSNSILYMQFSPITTTYGTLRSRNIYLMRRLFSYSKKKGLRIGFITLADSYLYMASYMQLKELAMLIGANEEQAMHGISTINKLIGD